jgi:hypothetical protein
MSLSDFMFDQLNFCICKSLSKAFEFSVATLTVNRRLQSAQRLAAPLRELIATGNTLFKQLHYQGLLFFAASFTPSGFP